MSLRIPSLDGLRAVSFLLVFAAHAGLESVVPGGLGVTIFFFLSGYLITTLLRVEYEKSKRISLKHFWLRRTLRILPPLYIVLASTAAIALMFDAPGTLTVPALAAQALQFTNYWVINNGYVGQPAGTGIYWSLAVEEHFYLLFPLLYIAMQRSVSSGRTQALMLWGLCGMVLLWRCYLVFVQDVSTNRTNMGSDTRVDSMLFGCALAVWQNPVLDQSPRRSDFWKFVVLPLSLCLLAATVLLRNAVFRETIRYSLQGIGLTAFFIVAIRCCKWGVFRLLNGRLLTFIGVLSYSLYLVHFAAIFGIARIVGPLHPLPQAMLSLALSTLIAWCIYVLVEKPCARLRRRLSG